MPLARLHSDTFHGVAAADGMTAFAASLGSNAIVAELTHSSDFSLRLAPTF